MDIRDKYGNVAYRIIGDYIFDTYGNRKYEIRGDYIFDTYGTRKFEIRGDYIFDTYGTRLGDIINIAEFLEPVNSNSGGASSGGSESSPEYGSGSAYEDSNKDDFVKGPDGQYYSASAMQNTKDFLSKTGLFDAIDKDEKLRNALIADIERRNEKEREQREIQERENRERAPRLKIGRGLSVVFAVLALILLYNSLIIEKVGISNLIFMLIIHLIFLSMFLFSSDPSIIFAIILFVILIIDVIVCIVQSGGVVSRILVGGFGALSITSWILLVTSREEF